MQILITLSGRDKQHIEGDKMGIDWMILRPKRKEYLTLPKRREWCNDLWKIWDILQDLEHGEHLIFINDESKEYGNILNNKEWAKADLSDDLDSRLYCVEDLMAGAHTGFYNAMRYKEKIEKGCADIDKAIKER